MSKCPKCGKEIKPLYMKENCPHCNVNLLYYNLENRLNEDAQKADREYGAVERLLKLIKTSSVGSPWVIVRLVLFFTPLAAMCLPVYGDLSLISLVTGIIDGSVEIGSVMLQVVSMALVVVLSLAVIIASLFSALKNGFVRNMLFSAVNAAAFIATGLVIFNSGINFGAGWYATLAILIFEFIMHIICKKQIDKKQNID